MNTTRKRGPQPGSNAPRKAVETARAAWGDALVDWVLVLAEACDRTSQGQVAKRLNYSAGTISSVINNTSKASFETIEKAVRGVLMAEELDCPVLGMIRTHYCLEHQKKARAFQPTSSMRVRLYRACRGGCPFSKLTATFTEDADAQS